MAKQSIAKDKTSVDAAFALAHSLGFDLMVGSGFDEDYGLYVYDAWVAVANAMNHLAEVSDMPSAGEAAFTAIERAIALHRAGYMEAPLDEAEPSSQMLEGPALHCAA